MLEGGHLVHQVLPCLEISGTRDRRHTSQPQHEVNAYGAKQPTLTSCICSLLGASMISKGVQLSQASLVLSHEHTTYNSPQTARPLFQFHNPKTLKP